MPAALMVTSDALTTHMTEQQERRARMQSSNWFAAAEGGSQMKDSPFVRSIILLLFLASGILSIYKYAFLAGNITDNVARMYAMFGLLLQFASRELRADRQLVLMGIAQNGLALEFAALALQQSEGEDFREVLKEGIE